MKHAGFMHIGEIAQTEALANQRLVGRNAGQTGADASPADIARVRAFLATRNPSEVDEAAVLRASQLGVELKIIWDHRFPRDDRGNPLPFEIGVRTVEAKGEPANCRAAAEAIRLLQTEADIRDIEGWLAELSVIVPKRQNDEFTEALRLEAYAGRLTRFPADVVRAVLLGRTWRFWPSWSELEKVCNELSVTRRAILRTLDAHGNPENATQAAKRQLQASAMEIVQEIWGARDRISTASENPDFACREDLASDVSRK